MSIFKDKSISAIKSCIEADEPVLLLDIIRDSYEAKIFALISCFTLIPSAKCIENLIAVGTPLDKSFENNPFHCTPQEYIDKHFNFTTNKLHTTARNTIYNAIQKGKLRLKNEEHIAITINLPHNDIKQSTVKKIGKMLLSPLIRH
jgi:hypothetical protein